MMDVTTYMRGDPMSTLPTALVRPQRRNWPVITIEVLAAAPTADGGIGRTACRHRPVLPTDRR
jgi:hypothetical protein